MKTFLRVIYNITRGLCRFFAFILLMIVVYVIKLLTLEPGKSKQITVRKARRIRTLSKIKNFIINSIPQNIIEFLGLDNYKNYFNMHIRNGLQLC